MTIKKKNQLSSFDIMLVSKELKSKLVGGFIDKIYQDDKAEVIIRVTVPNEQQRFENNNSELDLNIQKYRHYNLVIRVGKFVYIEDRDRNPESLEPQVHLKSRALVKSQPGSFAMLLRKHLKNGKIEDLVQYEFERIIIIQIAKREKSQLIIELFGDGNILLTKENIIIQPLYSRTWSARTLRAGEEYRFPPSRVDPRAVNENEFIDIMKKSNKDLVRTLIMDLDIPGRVSEEICFRMDIDKNQKPTQLTNEQYLNIFENIKKLFNEIEFNSKPMIYYESDNGNEKEHEYEHEPFEFGPINFDIFKEYHSKEYENYNSMVINYFKQTNGLMSGTGMGMAGTNEMVGTLDKVQFEENRLNRQFEQQKEAMKKFQKEIKSNHLKGETIYNSYQRCNELLLEIQQLRSKLEPDEIIENLTKKDDIKELNPHEGYVIIKLDEINTGETLDVKLDFRKNVMENANIYYERSKHAKEKLVGVESAIKTTRIALNEQKNKIYDLKTAEKPKFRPSLGRHFWFEKYHWFITSKGNLVAAGRDAKSNDQLVKKYLRDNDRYCHADLSGAPSVVVRADPDIDTGKVSEDTLEEACKFALTYSKAWNAKIGAGSAYWVKPDQVSKTPQSGEFLARGAFVIRGKRNYIANIKLELGLGVILYQGKRKLMSGPVDAVKVHCEMYVILVPGEVKKNSMAKQLSELFNVAIDDVLSALPAGGFKLLEKIGIEH